MRVSGGTAWPATAAARRLQRRNRRARRLGIDHVRATVHAREQGNYITLLLLHGPGYLFAAQMGFHVPRNTISISSKENAKTNETFDAAQHQ